MRKIVERIAAGIITCSGFLTSIVILLIVVFLFSEGLGLFSSKTIEEGYSLVVNKANPVEDLDARQIKEIFDEDITEWKDVGGTGGKIRLLRFDDMESLFSRERLGENYEHAEACLDSLIKADAGIIAFIPESYASKLKNGRMLDGHEISVGEVLGGNEWFPTATPAPQFGFVPLILGTIWVTVFAIIFALPFGLSVSIYMSEVASVRTCKMLRPIIELLNGIPSVVYGFFGLTVIVPILQDVFGLPVGESGLAGALVLAIMALPTIITVSQDAMQNCPRAMREASLALGASRWQTIYKVVMPYSVSGITSAVVLGIGRAFGETMAVLMVTGNAAVIPLSITDPLRTIPATIAAELGEAPAGGPHYQSLFLLGVVLFFITLIINTRVEYISSRNT